MGSPVGIGWVVLATAGYGFWNDPDAIGTAEDYGMSSRVGCRPLRHIAEDRTLWDRARRRARTYGIGPEPVATVGQEDEDRGVQLRDALLVTPYGQFSGPVRDYE